MGKLKYFCKLIRVYPVYRAYKSSANREVILQDMLFWKERRKLPYEKELDLLAHLLLEADGFRNLLIFRLGSKAGLTGKLFPADRTLVIGSGEIGPGLYIQHGFATILAAKSIGSECWINQQVTIGFEQDRQPVIGNHVRICAGAIIVGDVTVGDNSIVAAGAVVTKDIPAGEIWGGCPARFIKKVKGSSFDDQR